MPLEPPDNQYWQAALGYVLAVRVAIYHGLRKWDLLQVVTQKLAEYEP